MIEKIRADIPAGELTLQNVESFNDQSIARGVGDTGPPLPSAPAAREPLFEIEHLRGGAQFEP